MLLSSNYKYAAKKKYLNKINIRERKKQIIQIGWICNLLFI